MAGAVGQAGVGALSPGAAYVPSDITDLDINFDKPWTVEIRDQDRTLLQVLDLNDQGKWHERLNQEDGLTFRYPTQDSKAVDLVAPNQIWLFESNEVQPRQRFHILRKKQKWGGASDNYTVKCKSIMWQLSRERVTSYTTDGAAVLVETIVRDLLANHQGWDVPIGLGVMDQSIGTRTLTVNFENKSILQCFLEIWRMLNDSSVFWVHPAVNILYWREARDMDFKGHTLEIDKNLLTFEKETSYEELANRIYAYGQGTIPGNKLTLAGNPWVEDATSITAYGQRSAIFSRPTIKDQAALTDLANDQLDKHKNPVETSGYGLLDLSHLRRSVKYWSERIRIGHTVRVINPTDPTDENDTVIAEIMHDLDKPLGGDIGHGRTGGAGGAGRAGGAGSSTARLVDPSVPEDILGAPTFEELLAALFGRIGLLEAGDLGIEQDVPDVIADSIVFANFAAFPAAVDGHWAFAADLNNLYHSRGGVWRMEHPFTQAGTPASIGEANGDIWYETDTDNIFDYISGAWVERISGSFPTYTATTKANLPTTGLSKGEVGLATTPNRLYQVNAAENGWVSFTHLET